MLGSTAGKQAKISSKSAVVAVLAPICADEFRQAADGTNKSGEFKQGLLSSRAGFVEKGWPGNLFR